MTCQDHVAIPDFSAGGNFYSDDKPQSIFYKF